ncbi:hypothetical protein UFOVP257_34 [uncultured Caudovirales phage]|uniref:Uncharacterized protein n=1 Tax=uncultured Caudovirales phage TaxID=2100421 RepID=A0A6J5LFZ4_9CAUD|nr:hypothetical protein UFOVP257_34 [uncultured Caudovirales phage]
MNLFDNFLTELGTGDQIKDYKHASRLFVDNNYALSPKYDWLYHVFFDVNPQLSFIQNRDAISETGMLVKAIDLPKFSVENRVYNNYNRPNIVQTKIKYNNVNITFHDDQSNVVRNFWYDYYNYYYRDADIGITGGSGDVNPTYYAQSKYNTGDRSQLNRFGYSPRSNDSSATNQYIKSIRIYSLHQKKFTEYILVNPKIVDFSHGSHGAGNNGMLENSMTISYESVLYCSGYVTASTVLGFADLHYDKSPSPLSAAGGGTNSIMGPGGIVSAIDGFVQNPIMGAFGLARVLNKNKNVNLGTIAKAEAMTALNDVLNGKDPRNRFFVPTSGSRFGSPTPGYFPSSGQASAGSATSNGSSVLAAFGIASAGTNIKGSTSTTGAPLNTVVTLDGSGNQTGAVPQFSFNFLATALKKAQEDKKAKEEQAKAQEIGAGYAAAASAKTSQEISSGYASAAAATDAYVAKGSTVYETGTNNSIPGVQGSANSLAQTPYASTVVPASSSVAASEASSFVNNGNPTQLQPAQSYAGNNIQGSSTNPTPSTNGGVVI